MSLAESSHGTQFKIGDGATPTENFTTIAEVLDIEGPEETLDTHDVTSHDSPGHFEELIAGIRRSGNVTFDVNLVPSNATHLALRADQAARVKRNFKIIDTDAGAAECAFAALIVGYNPKRPVNGIRQATITLKVTGVVTVTP